MATNITSMLGMANYSYLFNNRSAKQNSINSLWSNYGSFQQNATSNLAALTEIRQNASAVVESYNDAKDTFYTEFDDTMAELKESANNVKNFNFNVGENAIVKAGEKDSEGNVASETTYSKSMQSALDTVKEFVDNYNDSIKFFQNNTAVSSRVEKLASEFGDTTYRSNAYAAIGISVASDGTLSINESTLAENIANDPDKVSSTLGSEGLAGKAENHIDTANAQRDRLFPTAKSMLGKQLEQAEIYTGGAYINMQNISNVGNLVNMMF